MATNRPALSANEKDAKSGWQQWIHQPQRLALYRTLFNVHYMIGVVSGIYLGLMSLTGAVLVYRDELSAWIPVEWLVKLHSNLLAGPIGRSVNGVGAACLAMLCLTGAFIWWPGIKNWRRSLTVGWRSNLARIQWDLHSALGFWSFPFIFVWAISGAYFAFPILFNAVIPSDSLGLLWLAELHFGRFDWATRAVWSIVGLAPAVLAFTGVFVCCRRIILHKPSNPN
ncbi:MAG: PepSY-associated TM helix domain-containing protein [Bryobacteraceae bacterium]